MSEDDRTLAGAIILENLSLFNKAAVFLEKNIIPQIQNAVYEYVAAWIKEHDWKGETKKSDLELHEIWVSPNRWIPNDRGGKKIKPFAKFTFGYYPNEDNNSYAIAELFGVGEAKFGFRFEVEYGVFGGKKPWDSYTQTRGDACLRLKSLGWVYEEGYGTFFLPVRPLPASKLVAAWKNEDWAEALQPLGEALDGLRNAQPFFDDILAVTKLKPE